MGWPSPLDTAFLKNIISCPSSAPPSFSIDDNIFDVKKKKSKDYYSLLVRKIAQYPNIINKLQNDFNFSIDQLRQIFSLPHSVVLQSHAKGFQFKVLNSILDTNSKLHKIGFKTDDLPVCSFCKAEPETLYHLFINTPMSNGFGVSFKVTGTKSQISRFKSKMFYLEYYPNHALY